MSENDKFKNGEHVDIGNFHGTIIETFMKNGRKWCKYKCNICGYEGEKDCYTILKGTGCSCCSNRVAVKGINSIVDTDPWMIKYFQGGEEEAAQYTKSCSKMIYPICPDCGRVKDIPVKINNIYNRHGISCVCGDGITFPNKFIYGLMEQFKTHGEISNYIREYQIENRKYDMYFVTNNGCKYLVEMDGGLNHGSLIIKYRPNRTPSEKMIVVDEIKNDLAYESNIELIRIDCFKSDFEYIKNNVLKSNLNNILNFSPINWNQLLEFCSTNLVKKVCDYRQNHPEAFSSEVGEIFHLSVSTVREYWKIGNQLGWCQFDGKAEMQRRNSVRTEYKKSIQTIAVRLQDGKEFVYPSMLEFLRKSGEIGIEITRKRLENLFKKSNPILNYQGFNIIKNIKEK